MFVGITSFTAAQTRPEQTRKSAEGETRIQRGQSPRKTGSRSGRLGRLFFDWSLTKTKGGPHQARNVFDALSSVDDEGAVRAGVGIAALVGEVCACERTAKSAEGFALDHKPFTAHR